MIDWLCRVYKSVYSTYTSIIQLTPASSLLIGLFSYMLVRPLSFAYNIAGAARSLMNAASMSMKMDIPKAAAAMVPAFVAATPAFASVDALQSTMPLSLEVTFAAYLAVLLGTFVPVTFLIVLYTQSEARKAGMS
jgi:photosystem II reaction center protein PsbM